MWRRVFPDDPPWNAPELMIANKLKVQPELLLVGELEGAIVAAVMAGFDGVRGWIHHLAVLPEQRRRGIATHLVRAAEQGLLALGCSKVNLQVRATNEAVVSFYRSLGYGVEERVSMGRRLRPASLPIELVQLTDYSQHADTVTSWLVDEWPTDPRGFAERRQVLLNPGNCPQTLLALAEGKPMGVLCFIRYSATEYVSPVIFIDALYVDASARGRGIGSALLAEAVVVAAAFEHELWVFSHIPEWYEARGWTLTPKEDDAPGRVLKRTVGLL